MSLKQLFEKNKNLRHLFELTKKSGAHLKQNIAQQGFYGTGDGSPRIFKPGEFVSEEDIGRYKIPAHLFIHPDSLRNTGAFDFAAKKKNIFNVGIIRTIKGLGDILILSVIGRALKEQYPGKVNIWFAVHPSYEVLLENNPYIDKVFTSEKELINAQPDVHLSVNDLEFKTEIRDEEKTICNRTALYLSKMGLSTENKTPYYKVTEEEKQFAKTELKKLKYDIYKPIIGIQLYGSNISKTYPHMKKVAKELKKNGYQIFFLDEKPYRYGLRQVIAIANEMILLITPNSFFYHVAGSLKKKAIALFGYTDGKIWTEDYEKVTPLQISCPKGKKRCWWKIECISGANLEEKENKATPDCLSKISVSQVLDEVDKQLVERQKVLILVLTYDFINLTKKMISSVRSFHNYDILVVDNESSDGTPEWLKERGIECIVKKSTVCQALNIGLKRAWKGGYDYILLCNNDIVLSPDYIDVVIEVAKRRQAYLVTGNVKDVDLGMVPDQPRSPEVLKKVEAYISLTAAGDYSALLISRKCIEKIGKFDEQFGPRYQEDEDHLLRVRLSGQKFIKTFATDFLHFRGRLVRKVAKEYETASANWNRNVHLFNKKWGFDVYAERNFLNDLQIIKQKQPNWARKIHIPLSDKKRGYDPNVRYTAVDVIKDVIRRKKVAKVLIKRRMGGFGDILFMSVIARVLKKRFKNKIEIDYAVPPDYRDVLNKNPYINYVLSPRNVVYQKYDFIVDLTDYEYMVEMAEVEEYGECKTSRTDGYLKMMGLKGDLKPDYFVSKNEKDWAEQRWGFANNKKRIVIVDKGSNKMKIWPQMMNLMEALEKKGFAVYLMKQDNFGHYSGTFREAAAIVLQADMCIANDSGLSNLAATLDIPAVTIFSSPNGKVFAKMFKTMIPIQGRCPYFPEKRYCNFNAPCFSGTIREYRKKENIKIPDCMQNLSIEEVLKVVENEII